MASQVDELVEYYANLLIIQYNSKEKATAEVSLIVRGLLADLVYLDAQNAYDLDTAIGVQLDILGKYIGALRGFNKYDFPRGVFAFTDDLEVRSGVFDKDKRGFFDVDNPIEGETFTGEKKLNVLFLNDDDYRLLLKLKIITNNTVASRGELDNNLFEVFGDGAVLTFEGVMEIAYTIKSEFQDIFIAAEQQGFFPSPAGVKFSFSVI